jgi:uncharacterized protein with PQ loop repeat
MDREVFAELIHWTWIMWVFGIINPCFMLPQLIKIWMTSGTEGISMITLILLVSIQVAFALHGFFIRDSAVMWSNAAAAFVSMLVVFSTIHFRQQSR